MKNLDDHSWFTVGFSLVKGRTLLKELIRERARRDLDKNLFESKRKNFDVYYWKYHTCSEGFMTRTFEK
jgi:hypothetical protein